MKKILLAAAFIAIAGGANAQSYNSPAAGQHYNGPSYADPTYCQYWASMGRLPGTCAPHAAARHCWRVKNRDKPGYHAVCRR